MAVVSYDFGWLCFLAGLSVLYMVHVGLRNEMTLLNKLHRTKLQAKNELNQVTMLSTPLHHTWLVVDTE